MLKYNVKVKIKVLKQVNYIKRVLIFNNFPTSLKEDNKKKKKTFIYIFIILFFQDSF